MLEMNLHWVGMMTLRNAGQIAELLTQLLGEKWFTTVSANECFDFKPTVRTCQRLDIA